jgi:hypothetical protein
MLVFLILSNILQKYNIKSKTAKFYLKKAEKSQLHKIKAFYQRFFSPFDMQYMTYNKKAHLLTNTEAVRIAFTLDREKRRATEEERAVLKQYSGFDGIKCVLMTFFFDL